MSQRAIDLFYESVPLIPHVEFYNAFVESTLFDIPKRVCSFRHTIGCEGQTVTISCDEFEVGDKPRRSDDPTKPLLPADVRGMKHKTYGVTVFAKVHVTSKDFEIDECFEVPVFTLPVCVGSKLCWEQNEKILNGHFIINGVSRAIITQEQNVTNKVIVNTDNKRKNPQCLVRCKHPVLNHVMEFAFVRRSKSDIDVRHHFFDKKAKIPAWKFLIAAGVDHETICEIMGDVPVLDRAQALLEIGQHLNRHMAVEDLELRTKRSIYEMFPQCPADRVPSLLMFMIEELLTRPAERYDSNENMCNKRFETCNKLLEDVVVSTYSSLLDRWRERLSSLVWMKSTVVSRVKSVLFRSDCDKAIDGCFKSGTWVIPQSSHPKKDVVEELRCENVWVSISQLRRTTSCNVGIKKGKQIEPRLIHPTMFGKTCMSETPEGEKAGVAKNLCVFSKYSRRRSATQLIRLVESLPDGPFKVFVDGVLLSKTVQSNARDVLVAMRRRGQIAHDVSISFDRFMDVRCDEGRIIECVLVAESDWTILEKAETIRDAVGVIEFLDAEEEWFNCRVVDRLEQGATHVRLHGCALFGVLACTVPFGNHNMGARITFYTHMLKRVVAPRLHRDLTFDTKSYELVYGQKPLVVTGIAAKALKHAIGDDSTDRRCADAEQLQFGGQNLVVLISSDPWTGEDAVVLADTAFGAGWTVTYDTYKYAVDLNSEQLVSTDPTKPSNDVRDAVPPKYTRVKPDDPILMKRKIDSGINTSEKVSALQHGWIDDVAYDLKSKELSISIRIHRVRSPQVGDKVNQRPGQKGTVAKIKPRYELPYSEATGMTPDLIINPNAFPSRMTVSFMFEGAESKKACFTGKPCEASPFGDGQPNTTESPVETFICPLTGKRMQPMWMAPMYVQMNAKFSDDALFSRALGPRSKKTRQPKHGRANEGALRFGEMEVWGTMTHGASAFAFDRLARCSDLVEMHVCKRCGRSAPPRECEFCHVEPEKIESKHAWAMVQAHLIASGIDVRRKSVHT